MEKNTLRFLKLEKKRSLFFQLGMVTALSATLLAFEWTTSSNNNNEFAWAGEVVVFDQEEIPITIMEEKKILPKLTDQIKIVPDEKEVKDDPVIFDSEGDQNKPLDDFIPPPPPEDPVAPPVVNDPFVIVEEMPSFPGGDGAMFSFLQSNIAYPQMAREIGTTGTVYVTFVVEKDGGITGVKVLRGIGSGCDEEAVRVVKSMPNWIPGKQRKRAVRVQMNLPIRFILKG